MLVFHDGKLTRACEVKYVKRIKGNRFKGRVIPYAEDKEVTACFKKVRRDLGGVWECKEHNLFYIKNKSDLKYVNEISKYVSKQYAEKLRGIVIGDFMRWLCK